MAKRRVDDTKLLELHAHGTEQKEIAKLFGVSPAYICKRLKRLTAPPLKIDSLTAKERTFVLEVAAGKSKTQAAYAAYDVTSRDSAKSLAGTLMKNPAIVEALTEIMECNGLGREYRVRKLAAHVENPDPGVSLRALDMSFKLADDYPAAKNMHLNVNLANIDPIDLSEFRKEYGK